MEESGMGLRNADQRMVVVKDECIIGEDGRDRLQQHGARPYHRVQSHACSSQGGYEYAMDTQYGRLVRVQSHVLATPSTTIRLQPCGGSKASGTNTYIVASV